MNEKGVHIEGSGLELGLYGGLRMPPTTPQPTVSAELAVLEEEEKGQGSESDLMAH